MKDKFEIKTRKGKDFKFKTITFFDEKNGIFFGQDHSMWQNIPTNVEFAVKHSNDELFLTKNDTLKLIGDGYGMLDKYKLKYKMCGEYGNGGLSIYLSDLPEDVLTALGIEIQPIWKKELKKITQQEQRQDSLTSQLNDLVIVANRFGFYDAADWIKQLNDA